jgi:glycyl-tRNA synthetase beta chain
MPDLLLEIGVEELPASACREALAQLPELCRKHIGVEPTSVWVGPRRLTLLVENLPARTADSWVKGPPATMNEKAIEGFARKHGTTPAGLVERDGFLGVDVPGRPLGEVLPDLLVEIVRGLSFGKSMVWRAGGMRFSRAVRWLLAKLDSDTIDFEVEGIRSGTFTFGHRFTHGQLEVFDTGAYLGYLRNARVEPDHEARRRDIVTQLDAVGPWSDPLRKLEEVIHLVESPTVIVGSFDERFLKLPPRVVETAMQAHQRYFPLGGSRFAFVANGGDPDVVRAGNERVLEGRLEDATFTFDRDVAAGIEGLFGRLGVITFFAGAGSFADKAVRLVELVRELGGEEDALAAARLAKADQAAELVREFTELEGHIGSVYARLAGLPETVCAAIEEQYLPDSAGGPLPETPAGRLIATADKIDTLRISFSLGHRPTGSRDPYALRRSAIGLCRLATEGGVRIPRALLGDDVREFVEERLEGVLDVPVEMVRAARRSAVTDLGAVAALARALATATPEQIGPAHTAYTRCERIAAGKAEPGPFDAALLVEPAEHAVADALAAVGPRIAAAVAAGDYAAGLAAAADLGPALERFFVDVLVMAEEPVLREARLRLLLAVRDAVGALGDFAQIPL